MSALEILVRGPNWTGDLVMATPGFRALRAGFPRARITLHVRASQAALLEGAPWFDAVLPFPEPADGASVLREARALRARGRFDLGLCLPDSFGAALLMRAAGVRRVVGYARNGRGALLHQRVPWPAEAGRRGLLPRELHVLGLVEALGCARRGLALELFVSEREQREADAALAAAGAEPDAPLALLAPGASFGASKHWPVDSFAAVGDALVRGGARVVVTGSPAERALCARVRAAMREPSLDLAGALGLGALKGLMRRARLLVANDAGARHVAVALGLPVVLVMGPTSLDKTSCNLERVSVLSADVPCRPCYLRDCPIDHRCMTRVAPEWVAEEAARAFAAPARFAGVQRQLGRIAA
jgi:heptosyltransferase-2